MEEGGQERVKLRVKINFAGESNVGKTALITREVSDSYREGFYQASIGLDFMVKEYEVGGCSAKVHLWDIAGGDCRMAYRKPFFRGTQAVCICFGLNEPYSFERAAVWLAAIRSFELNCPIWLVGCKSDLPQAIPEEDITRFAQAEGLQYFKCSAKEDTGVKENLARLVEKVVVDILSSPENIARQRIAPCPPPSTSFCRV